MNDNIPAKALFTAQEIAALTGWTVQYTWRYVSQNKVPRVRVGRYTLFTAETVRELVWKTDGHKRLAKGASPFLLQEVIEWFIEYKKREDLPSDMDFAADAKFERKVKRISELPDDKRAAAMSDLMEKIALAKKVT